VKIESLVRPDDQGVERRYLVLTPPHASGVLLLFHPFGFDAESVLYGEEPGSRLIRRLEGALEPANRFGFAVVAPQALGRAVRGVSLGYERHLAACRAVALEYASALGGRLVAGGLSMGGLEALSFAGRYPNDVAAAWAVNPVVDLAQWYRDIPPESGADPRQPAVTTVIVEEVGATPDDDPGAYAARSPLSYIDALSGVPLLVMWTPEDGVIPNARLAHAGRLVRLVRGMGGWVDERVLTHTSPDGNDPGRYAHESCDMWTTAAFTARALEQSSDLSGHRSTRPG
jgi:pimeloyl-ACP methyl ester carboxylesterase